MKRKDVLLQLQRFYSIKHCMVEAGYLSPADFMDEVLALAESLGMKPYWEKTGKVYFNMDAEHKWEEE